MGVCRPTVIRQIQKEIPVAGDDACKEWQEVSTQSVQTDDVKGNAHISLLGPIYIIALAWNRQPNASLAIPC